MSAIIMLVAKDAASDNTKWWVCYYIYSLILWLSELIQIFMPQDLLRLHFF